MYVHMGDSANAGAAGVGAAAGAIGVAAKLLGG
jgi:hypothetical protein